MSASAHTLFFASPMIGCRHIADGKCAAPYCRGPDTVWDGISVDDVAAAFQLIEKKKKKRRKKVR